MGGHLLLKIKTSDDAEKQKSYPSREGWLLFLSSSFFILRIGTAKPPRITSPSAL